MPSYHVHVSFRTDSIERFTFAELADMHLVYGGARGNARLTARTYQEMYPARRHPCRATFVAIDRRQRERGMLQIRRADGGQRTARTPAFEEEVLERL